MTKPSAPRFPLLIFCQKLLSLLEAGLQLVEAVDTLKKRERDTEQYDVLAGLHANLQSGLSFSLALAQFPNVFPPLFQAAIEANEQTGGVAQALKRFVVYETQYQALRSRLIVH